MMGGGFTPELQRFLGRHQLHQFFGGFAARNINTVKGLKGLSKEEIIKIGADMNMPPKAMDRLLEEIGKKEKEKPQNIAAKPQPTVPRHDKKPVKNPPPKATPEADEKEEKAVPAGAKSKTQASTYYHFASTDKAKAAKYDAKVVTDAKEATWKAAKGASAWNPGNTFEDRDYTSFANERWKEMMVGYVWPGLDIRIKSFSKTNMDYSIIINRQKVKYIYDMSFTCKWKGKVDGEKCEGTLSMADICPDDDEDEWEFEVTSKAGSANQVAKACIETGKSIIIAKVHELLAELKKKGPQS